MGTPQNKTVAVTWSGGIDSTAVVGQLLHAGYEVIPVAIKMGPYHFMKNEQRARDEISHYFGERYPSTWNKPREIDGEFLTLFSSDGGKEVLRRNKHILDYVMMNFVIAQDLYYVATGSHLGAYPPAVDHLPGGDSDSREMIAYMLQEYGLAYQLITMLDFGPSRYKTDRIRQLLEHVPAPYCFQTYNCLTTSLPHMHCGRCYKCVERHAAFETIAHDSDKTRYETHPKKSEMYAGYIGHFKGVCPKFIWDDVKEEGMGSHVKGVRNG